MHVYAKLNVALYRILFTFYGVFVCSGEAIFLGLQFEQGTSQLVEGFPSSLSGALSPHTQYVYVEVDPVHSDSSCKLVFEGCGEPL